MTTTPAEGTRAHRVQPRLLAGVVAIAVLVGGGVGWAVTRPASGAAVKVANADPTGIPLPIPVAIHVPLPIVSPVGQSAGRVPWDKPLAVSVTDGTLRSVTASDSDGKPVDGALSPAGWSSTGTLVPASTYRLAATVVDNAGKARRVAVTTRTTAATNTLHAVLSPGDAKVVGVGMTVIALLNRDVTNAADRKAVVHSLTVTTTPAVRGRWRWMSPTELHYRGPRYWTAGTKITAHADFSRLHLADGTWGEGVVDIRYRIGSRLVSTVDVSRHIMTVVQDSKLLRIVKVSTGRAKYPTKGGVHLVLEKTKLKIMDSATVGIPRDSPVGYYEKVPNSVRISYGGAFIHSAGWSVRDQGVRNVSHGCVNISPSDAAWYFDLVKRGDVVNVINAGVPPRLSDPGMSDWNIPFRNWAN